MKEIKFETKAVLNNYRSTPQKTRRVINLVRGKDVEEARAILKFAPQEAAAAVLKLLNSAVANALTKADRTGLRVNEDTLFISEIFADEGPTMKRFRPRARGSAGRIFKRTSHITLFVGTYEDVIAAPKRSKADDKKPAKDSVKEAKSEENAKAAAVEAESAVKDSKDPKAKDSTKAAGKAHRSVGEKSIKAHGDNANAKAAAGHRKENMRKKGA